jgi:hypothetical protein
MVRDAGASASVSPREGWLREIADPSRLTVLFASSELAGPSPPAWQDQLAPWRATMQAYRIAPASGRPEEFLRFTEAFGGKESVVVVRPMHTWASPAGSTLSLT